MKKLILVLSMFSVITAHAQTIKGYVLSATDNKPAEFANVILVQLPDSTFHSGVITYTEGDYTIESVKPGKYYIKSSFVGFEENGTEIEITSDKEVFMADTIYLSENTNELGEVAVKGDMIRATELVDRTVYTIPPEIAKTSSNGFEVLRKIPSVQVDFNNNVTLNGKSNFIIQVDGKQRDKEFLARLRPEDIKSVEVIHNPGGKYDGTIDGVLNIKLTKEARQGISGNLAGMIRPAEKLSGYVAGGLDYGLEKVTFYVSGYSFFQGLDNRTTNYNIQKIILNPDSIINTEGYGDFRINASSINTGFDYYINDKNKLSLNVNYKPARFLTELDNSGKITDDDTLVFNQFYQSNNKTNSDEINASIFYKKEFEKPIQELTIEMSYYLFNSLDKNKFNTQLFGANDVPFTTFGYDENVNNDRNYLSSKIDYVHPLGKKMRIETGYQLYYQKMNYDFINSNDAQNNLFEYNEYRNAAYAGFILNLKKFSFMANLRTEYSDIGINKDAKSDYFTFLPSTNIQYKINKSQNLKFTYNRRINRPGVYNLNPFEKQNYDGSVTTTGNPLLKPELRDKVQLTYTLNFGKSNIAPHIYYERITDKISTTYRTAIRDDLSEYTLIAPENLLSGYRTGFGLNAMLGFFNLNGSVYKGYYEEYNNLLKPIKEQEYISFNLNSYIYAPLFKKKFHVFAFCSYNGVQVNAESKTYSTPFYGFGGQKKYKNHTFGFFYFLPFGKELRISETITESADYYSKTTNNFDVSYYLQISYSYNFSKGKSIKKLKRKTEVESDTKSGGIGR
jgi:hypothetical protein